MVAAGRQLPDRGEIYLDHVGWMVPDMDAATRTFTRLGFALTPYSLHGNQDPETGRMVQQGSANRLAMLERGYLEILTPVAGAATAMTRHLKDSMGRYVCVHLIAFAVADAEAEAGRLAGAGFRLQPRVDLRRTIEAADGSAVQVAFNIAGGRFMHTALMSVRLGLPGFLLPVVFALRPELLGLTGTVSDQIWVFAVTLAAVGALNLVLEGYFLTRMAWWERAVLIPAAAALLLPGWWTVGAGGMMFLAVAGHQVLASRGYRASRKSNPSL